MRTQKKTGAWGGVYDYVKEHVYVVERGIKGFISWEETVHTDRIENTRSLIITTSDKPDDVIINGITYVPVTRGG